MGVRLIEDIRPISYVKNHAAEVLEQINERRSPLVITQNGEARGVMLDIRSYQEMTDALVLMKLLERSEGDIQTDATKKHSEVFDSLRKKIDQYGQ